MLLTRRGSTLTVPSLTELSWFPFLDPTMRLEKYRQDDKFVVRAEIPGIDPAKDASITAQDGVLRISVVHQKQTDDGAYSEFRYGTFYRTVMLPPGTKEDTISANYAYGILEITMTVGEPEHLTRSIPVTIPNSQPQPVAKS